MKYVYAFALGIALILSVYGTKHFVSIGYENKLSIKQSEIDTLKSRITLLDAHRDTIYIKGVTTKIDSTKKFDSNAVSIRYIDSAIDTSTYNSDSSVFVSIIKLENSKDIEILAVCTGYDYLFTRADTLKIKVPYPIEVPIPAKPSPWYNTFGFGFGSGVVMTGALLYLYSRINR